jgi:4-cresol dehydrogenase (hydroxylating) flavoprotein subunit
MLEEAITEFRQIVGDEHTLAEAGSLERYAWCTIPLQRRIAAAVRPASVEELQRLIGVAAAHRLPLYPISTGQNWGYGSGLPAQDHNVIVDLGRMNRIVEVNTELAYAVVEPGVTQHQLYRHLQDQHIPLRLNPTGAGPGRSILGNTLERGFGIGPNGDHFLAQCGMEVVLASGEILHTGFGHYPGARATHVYKWGVGPYLDGIFTQSNFGIVTKIGVWLEPAPESFEACYLTCYSDAQLGPLVDGVRQLLFSGVFRGPMNLLHRNRVLIMLDRYPWAEMGGRTPLSESVAQRLASQKRLGAWNGVGAISGSRAQVRAARQTIRRTLRGRVDRITFLSDRKLQLLQRFPKTLSVVLNMNVPDLLKTLQSSYGLLKGIPSEIALSLAYWRNRRPRSPGSELNPARDRSGLMWFAPIVPMTSEDVLTFRRIVEPIFARHGFEACITFTAVNERCFDCTLPVLYDKDDVNQVHGAQVCYQELLEECRRHGYVPYRLGLQSMKAETARDDVFWQVVTRLKEALDPQGILAPGRYSR